MSKQTYTVAIERVTNHLFTVSDVNSPDEAVLVAEGLLEDGELGEIIDKEILGSDAWVDGEEN